MKQQVINYSFDKTAKTVTFTDYTSISLDRILLIVNTTKNIIIYNFADATKGGTVATNVLTLAYDTSSMANTDKLLIYYENDLINTATDFTITLASLASSTTGVGRQSTLIDNTKTQYSSALIYCKITVGTSPTANSPIYVYLIRSDNGTPIAGDGAGVSDAAITIKNAVLLDVITCTAATSDTAYYKTMDTKFVGSLGPKWGIAVVNSTGAALNSTVGNHEISWVGIK